MWWAETQYKNLRLKCGRDAAKNKNFEAVLGNCIDEHLYGRWWIIIFFRDSQVYQTSTTRELWVTSHKTESLDMFSAGMMSLFELRILHNLSNSFILVSRSPYLWSGVVEVMNATTKMPALSSTYPLSRMLTSWPGYADSMWSWAPLCHYLLAQTRSWLNVSHRSLYFAAHKLIFGASGRSCGWQKKAININFGLNVKWKM